MARRKSRKNPLFYLEGAEGVNKELRRLGNTASGYVVKEAAEAGAQVIADEASRLAPKDTGLLSESIDDQPKRLQVGRAQIEVGPSKEAWYGQLLEKGTSNMPAQPFLRPAFDSSKDKAVAAVKDVLRRLLRL
jgi:HK97 gp10 family phage protein